MASFRIAQWWRRNLLVCIFFLLYSFSSLFNTILHCYYYKDDYYFLQHINMSHVKVTCFWTIFLDLWSSTGSYLYAPEDYLWSVKVPPDVVRSRFRCFQWRTTWYLCHLDSGVLFSYTTAWSIGHWIILETIRGSLVLRTVEHWHCVLSILAMLDTVTLHIMRVTLMIQQSL